MSDLQSFNNKWLIGSGEIGKRIAAFDWSRHPLGPIECWPQSLKTIIHTMLNSRYSMWMGWGPEFYFFCNDAYLPTLGIKERWALGASARKVWAEIWPDIGPRAESVVRTGQAAWDESVLLFLERGGHIEESYQTFSYSPIPDDFGAIGGVLCVVTDETERVVSARRFDLLRKLGSDLAAISTEKELFSSLSRRLNECAKELPFVLIYLFNPAENRANLACAHGAQPGARIAPAAIALESAETIWPAQKLFTGSAPVIVDDLAAFVDDVPRGAWTVGPRQAVILPIAFQLQETPAGFLVAGLNPFRSFDVEYQGFLNLLVGQISAALSNLRAEVEARRRSEAQKTAAAALRESEERMQQLVSLMPAAIYTCDEVGRITYYNKRAVELWGREPELVSNAEKFTGSYRLRRPDGGLLPPDQSAMASAIRHGESVHDTEVQVERPDGTRIVISANIEPLHDHQGRRRGAIGVFQDVSERKAAERELHRHTEHIQLLSETVAQLLRATNPDSIMRNLFGKVAGHVGADRYLHFMVNDAGDALELHSCAGISDAVQTSIARFDLGHAIFGTASQHPIIANDLQNSHDEKTAAMRRLGFQTFTCNPLMVGDRLLGSLLFASQTRKSFDADEIELLHIVTQYAAIALDRLRAAKALGESEEQLRRQAQDLEQQLIATGRLVSLGEITASMAHEFNNPLGIILGFVEDLLLSTDPADTSFRPLQIVDEEAKRCQRIIQDLMDYTRPRAVTLTSTSLRTIIDKTLGLVETRLYKQKITRETTLEPDLPSVYADYQQLEQVFINLYLNAIDAMPQGGKLTVSAGLCRDQGELAVVVGVSDTGFGIEPELLSKIFQPFYTAKKTRGMGLGLPITQRIVRNHGGHIEVTSTPGQGSTFRVYLPLIDTEHAPHSRNR